ncbi:MAG: hypothetical protein NVS9B10_11290 [Nevskia sp.]
MIRTRNLVILGAAVFLVSLLLNAPVALLHAKLAPPGNGGGLQPSGLDGTLAEGRASSLLMNGRPLLGKLHWRFKPWSLLLARLAFQIDSSGDLTMDGTATRPVTGGLDIDGLRAAGPLKDLLSLTGDVGVPVAGQFGLRLDSARIRSGFVNRVDGEVTINGLKWTLAKDPVLLGDFLLRIATEKDVITGRLEPLSGPLDVGGEIRVKTDRSYEIDLTVKATPNAEPLVQNLVRSLGQPDAQGNFHIRSAGSLAGGAPPPAAPVANPEPR